VRNEGSPSTPEFVRRWLPRRPDGPQRGRPTGTSDRRGSVAGRARRAERDTADH
jgi:hypothetical protein